MGQRRNITTSSAGGRDPAAAGYGIAVAVIAAVLLLYLAVPRVTSAFLSLPERHLLDDVRVNRQVDLLAVEALLDSRRAAAGWSDSAQLHSEIAMAHLLAAEASGQTADAREQNLRDAALELKYSLRHGPASPHAWTRLAYAEMLLYGPSESSASALIMSMLAARYEPDLMFARLQLSLISRPFFSPSDLDMVNAQIRLAWQRSPKRVAGLARSEAWADMLRSAFVRDPDALADFERRTAPTE